MNYTGQPVRKGEPLFSIYSPDLVSAEQEYLLALQTQKALASKPGAERHRIGRFARAGEPRAPAALGPERDADPPPRGSRQTGSSADDAIARVGNRPREDGGRRPKRAAGHAPLPDRRPLHGLGLRRRLRVRDAVREGRADGGDPAVVCARPIASRRASPTSIRRSTRRPAPSKSGSISRTPKDLSCGPRCTATSSSAFRSASASSCPRPRFSIRAGARSSSSTAATAVSIPRDVELGDRVDDWSRSKRVSPPGERVVTSANFLVDSESQLQGAESMMGMMGAIGMGDWKMESAKPMSMGGEAGAPASRRRRHAFEEKTSRRSLDRRLPCHRDGEGRRVSDPRPRSRCRAARRSSRAKVSFNYTMDMPGMTIEQRRGQARSVTASTKGRRSSRWAGRGAGRRRSTAPGSRRCARSSSCG